MRARKPCGMIRAYVPTDCFGSLLCLELLRGVRVKKEIAMNSHDLPESPSEPAMAVDPSDLIALILDNIPQAAFWKDRALVYRWCNPVFARNAGLYSPAAINGLTDFDLPWTQSQIRAYREMDHAVINGNQSLLGIIERQTCADGRETWLVTNKVPLHDAQGNVLGVLGTVDDITELHHAKESLRKMNESLEDRVRERTAELTLVNEQLKHQIHERKRAQQAQISSEAREEQQRSVAEALQSTARLLSNTLDLKEVLQRLLITIGRVVSCDSSAVLLIRDEAANLVHRWPASEWLVKQLEGIPLGALLDGMSSLDAARSEAMLFSSSREGWAHWLVIHGNPAISEVLCVPIVADDELIGLISLASNRSGLFDNHMQSVLNVFSDQAAAAIRNANLYSQAQHLAAVEERQRIARDLHDAVSQTLWSARVLVDVLPDLVDTPGADWRNVTSQLHQLIEGAQSEMRTLLWELRPESITSVDLRDLLAQLTNAVICRRNLKISLEVEGQGKLPDEVVYGVYRIVQEALANVVKHSNAAKVAITLRYDSEALSLRIVDDGVGFDSTQGRSGGLGFSSMTERAQGIGGEITIQAQAGHGTHVMLNWAR